MKLVRAVAFLLVAMIVLATWMHVTNASCILRIVTACVVVWRLGADGIAVNRRKMPASRLLLPAIALGVVVAVGNGQLPRPAVLVIIGAVDAFAVALALVVLRTKREPTSEPPEIRLARRLAAVFPDALARIAAAEVTIALSALRAPGLVIRNASASAVSYVENAKIKWLVFALPVTLVPDLLLIELFVPAHLVWLRITLALASLYAVIWVWGMYAAMAGREHALSDTAFVFNRGLMKSVRVDPAFVEKLEIIPPRRGFATLRRRVGEADLGVAGVASVRIALSRSVPVQGLAGLGTRDVNTIIVPSDRPTLLAARIADIAAATGRANANLL